MLKGQQVNTKLWTIEL